MSPAFFVTCGMLIAVMQNRLETDRVPPPPPVRDAVTVAYQCSDGSCDTSDLVHRCRRLAKLVRKFDGSDR